MASGDPIVRHVVTFGRVLREVGIEVGPGRVIDAMRALDAVDLTRQDDVYFALRHTLVSRQDELELFDRAFLAWFLRAPVIPPQRLVQPVPQLQRLSDTIQDRAGTEEAPGDGEIELGASGQELLKDKDFGEMSADEFRRVRRLMLEIARRRPQRR